MKIIDLHCDTIMECHFGNETLKTRSGHITAEKLQKGSSLAQCFALYLTKGHLPDEEQWQLYNDMYGTFLANIGDCKDIIRRAYTADDVAKNADDGYISAILTVEDGACVNGKAERLLKMKNDGVRMIALTWNYENCFGFPNSADSSLHSKGLKDFGKESISLMNDLGIIVDVSHLSEGGFWDVAKITTKPFIASHSCSRSLRDHPRNLTDEQLKAIAEKGGVVGINFFYSFLTDKGNTTCISDVIAHLEHIRKVAGIDTLAWGSDFDGIGGDLQFGDFAGFPMILDELSKHFTSDEIDKINNLNFLRVLKEQNV